MKQQIYFDAVVWGIVFVGILILALWYTACGGSIMEICLACGKAFDGDVAIDPDKMFCNDCVNSPLPIEDEAP